MEDKASIPAALGQLPLTIITAGRFNVWSGALSRQIRSKPGSTGRDLSRSIASSVVCELIMVEFVIDARLPNVGID